MTITTGKQKKEVLLANDKIRFDHVQLITHEGKNLGVVSRREALQAAHEAQLDLVIIAEQGAEGYPVAKLIDLGKMQYEKKKQQAEAKKKQHIVQVKEIKLRPKIADHDFQTKLKQGVRFLQEGKHLKITLMFRGREAAMKHEVGAQMFERIRAILDAGSYDGKAVSQESDMQTSNFWTRVFGLKK